MAFDPKAGFDPEALKREVLKKLEEAKKSKDKPLNG